MREQHGIPVPVTQVKAVQHRPQFISHQLRRRHPRRSVERAAGGHVRLVPCRWRKRPTVPSMSRSITCAAIPVAINGRKLSPANSARASQRHRRKTWHWPGRPRREPLRRHEVARRVRNPRRHDPARGASRSGVDHDGSRSDAPAGFADAALRRDDLLRLLVRAGARSAAKTIDAAQANVTGRVRLKLYKGNVMVVGRKSDASLYDPNVATFEARSGLSSGRRRRLHSFERVAFAACSACTGPSEADVAKREGEKRPSSGVDASPLRTADSVEAFTASIDVDARLYRHDIMGSIAHAQNARASSASSNRRDARRLSAAWKRFEREIDARQVSVFASGRRYSYEYRAAPDRDDRLRPAASSTPRAAATIKWRSTCGFFCATRSSSSSASLSGVAAESLRGGRKTSRRDHARLYAFAAGAAGAFRAPSAGLLSICSSAIGERFAGCRERINVLPLGSGALAGTTFPIDRAYVAKLLGFPAHFEKQHRRGERPRFSLEFLGRVVDSVRPSEPARRRIGLVVEPGVRLHRVAGRLLHGQLDDAAEKIPTCRN